MVLLKDFPKSKAQLKYIPLNHFIGLRLTVPSKYRFFPLDPHPPLLAPAKPDRRIQRGLHRNCRRRMVLVPVSQAFGGERSRRERDNAKATGTKALKMKSIFKARTENKSLTENLKILISFYTKYIAFIFQFNLHRNCWRDMVLVPVSKGFDGEGSLRQRDNAKSTRTYVLKIKTFLKQEPKKSTDDLKKRFS